jgi:predicted TIM-barrel fold metal-dependent hydrolase
LSHAHLRQPVSGRAERQAPAAGCDRRRLSPIAETDRATRNVVVTPSTYGTDNSSTLDAIARLGPTARGVAVVDTSVTDAELKRLDGLGMRGIRFNLVITGATTLDMLEPLSKRVNDLGWHVQIQMLGDQIVDSADLLQRLPSPIVFGHMARIPEPAGVDHPAFQLGAEADRSRPDLGQALERLPGLEERPARLWRRQQGHQGLRQSRAGANGLGQRLAAPDRKGGRKAR